MSNSKINAAKGRRYSAKEKAEIVAFVDKVNADKGRGGQSAAAKKFKISPLTIASWIRSGVGGTEAFAISSNSASGPISRKLAKLQALHEQISRAERELGKMKTQFNALKAAL
ncbi:MAG: hypothetical protein EAZ84_10195 [Verrucomicrobia bacterium]|nr:MAG: hypothetical protein EAZ84_10195 [Verrucomicrobiota bacterium]TAE86363.1 MAG: hypothetical protein EAZ82_11360 [Verrucomicrobiota bacterium]TAF24352.1 MAG: hypothetical protein EAZ71_10785 [Verrucomicrobiota bacterium]